MSVLREYRKKAGLTQVQLKNIAGVSHGIVCNLETKVARNPRTDTIVSLAHVLSEQLSVPEDTIIIDLLRDYHPRTQNKTN